MIHMLEAVLESREEAGSSRQEKARGREIFSCRLLLLPANLFYRVLSPRPKSCVLFAMSCRLLLPPADFLSCLAGNDFRSGRAHLLKSAVAVAGI